MPSNSGDLVTNDNNLGSVGTQTENSSSKNSLEQKIESLGKEIKSLRKQNQLNSGIIRLGVIGLVGYIIATNWSTIASAFATAGTATAAASPVIGIVVGAIIGAAVLVGASYAAWRYRAEIKAGFQYAANKTVEGTKYTAEKVKSASIYTAGKIKAGAVRAKNSVKEAASSVGQATRERTGSALRTMGDSVQEFGRKMSNSGASMSSLDSIPYSIEPYGQTVVLKTKGKTKNFNSVKEMFIKEVFEDKAVNSSALTREIFSELKGKILEKAYSVDGQQGFKKDQLINQLGQQADFVSKLNAKKLQKLLARDDNNLYEIFSEHHSEIKEIIRERKTEHKLSNVVEELSDIARKHGRRVSSTQSTPPSLSVSSSMSSLNSVITDSTNDFPAPTWLQSPPVNLDPFGSIDNGGLPGPFTSGKRKRNVSPDNLSEARRKLRKTGSSYKSGQPPSTRVFGQESKQVNQRLETLI